MNELFAKNVYFYENVLNYLICLQVSMYNHVHFFLFVDNGVPKNRNDVFLILKYFVFLNLFKLFFIFCLFLSYSKDKII